MKNWHDDILGRMQKTVSNNYTDTQKEVDSKIEAINKEIAQAEDKVKKFTKAGSVTEAIEQEKVIADLKKNLELLVEYKDKVDHQIPMDRGIYMEYGQEISSHYKGIIFGKYEEMLTAVMTARRKMTEIIETIAEEDDILHSLSNMAEAFENKYPAVPSHFVNNVVRNILLNDSMGTLTYQIQNEIEIHRPDQVASVEDKQEEGTE